MEVPVGAPAILGPPAPDIVEVATLERKRKAPAEADVVEIASDSGSSSSDSESSSGSRSRQRGKQVGAAAATALLTSFQPLDVDEPEKSEERELVLPTSFIAPLQHEGGLVAIMVETGAQISVNPRAEDPNESVVRLSGSEHSVGRAVSSLEVARSAQQRAEPAAPAPTVLAQVQVPARHLNAVVGPSSLAEIRAKCGGLMIAVQPPQQPGGPGVAHLGPSSPEDVALAEKEIRERIRLAEAAAAAAPGRPADDPGVVPGAEGTADAHERLLHRRATDGEAIGAATAGEPPPKAEPETGAEVAGLGVEGACGTTQDGTADSDDLEDIP